jgi:hypothetical protein
MTSVLAAAIIVKVAVDLRLEGGRLAHSLLGRFAGGREAAERWDLWLWADCDLVAAKELRRRLTGDLERLIMTERSLRRIAEGPDFALVFRCMKGEAERALDRLDMTVRYFHGGWDALPDHRLQLMRACPRKGPLMLVR